MKEKLENIFESVLIHIIGAGFVISGAYEAIFDDVSWTVYVPLVLFGVFLIKSPLTKIYEISLEWIKSKIGGIK